ncbi:MAG: M4 family metallopeptidase [Bryobacterales bacterium]|nr:M4 family metallopeptidase [Bryobacterales bacterium]
MTANQERLLEALRKRAPGLTVRWNEERGVASLIEGRLLPWERIKGTENMLRPVLADHGELLGPPDVLEGHRPAGARRLRTGEVRAKAFQVFDTLPVYGATLLAFADVERGVYRVQSSFWREVKVTAGQRVKETELEPRLLETLRRNPEAAGFEEAWRRRKQPDPWLQEHFPLTARPKLYLYPVEKGFHPAYDLWAYQLVEWLGVDGKPRRDVMVVELMLDAATGQVLWQEPAREGMAYTDQTGDGLSTLQDSSGTQITRTLHVVRKDAGNYYMINRLRDPEIRTYDAGGTETGLVDKLKGEADISQDADLHWNQTTTSCASNDRRDSQQPEVDGHFNAEQAFDFYHGLDWHGFDNANWGAACPVRVAAHIGLGFNAYFEKYTEWDPGLNANKYYGYIAFYDGECTGGAVSADFMAGDPVIFAHEYQHAITFFGAAKSTGEPGHLYGTMWLGAIREGFSDSLGCLRHGFWVNPVPWRDGALRSGQPFRRIEYPRSTNTDDGAWYCDHYADRDANKDKYFHSSLLSHTAFLAGQGGIHERASRAAQLIPVSGVGNERMAEIFIYALTNYYDTIPLNLAGETLIEAGKLLLDAAEQVSGSNRTCEYVMLRRALYAVGLYPFDAAYNAQNYGGEACMLPWTIDWRFSQPYLGMPAMWYQSPDLFINNGSGADYDAVIGQENKLFARVRNIGDQALSNVRVRFYFCPAGTNLPAGIAGWHPCKNQAGTDCVLDIPALAAGSMNFTDPANPPASQAVKWYLDPAYVTPEVGHFCLRARIECTAPNHDNDCPYEVQSNVQHVEADGITEFQFSMRAQNWLDRPVPLEVKLAHSLPKGFTLRPDRRWEQEVVKRGEPRVLRWRVRPSATRSALLEPPFDGRVTAHLRGEISGRFEGELSEVKLLTRLPARPAGKAVVRLQGRLAGAFRPLPGKRSPQGRIAGRLEGEFDLRTGVIRGQLQGGAASAKGGFLPLAKLELEGALEPLRAIHVSQAIAGRNAGGVSIRVKLPRLRTARDPAAWR